MSHVTSFNNTFRKALQFNQPLGSWDVSSATNMSRMFFRAQAFNQDLSAWDVSAVDRMNTMFKRAFVFNQDLSSWDVAQVVNMDHMFRAAYAFNQDLSAWCVPLIASKPAGFDANTPLNNAQLPQWGGCGANASKSLGNAPALNVLTSAVPIEAQSTTAISLYPNPTQGTITLSETFQGSYRLTDSRGTLIEEGQTASSFDLSDQPTGLYFLTLFTSEGTSVFRLLKE